MTWDDAGTIKPKNAARKMKGAFLNTMLLLLTQDWEND
jgi:hypothetical protein